MRSLFYWAVENLSYLVGGAFVASILSLAFSIVQVRNRMKEIRRTMAREIIATSSGQVSEPVPDEQSRQSPTTDEALPPAQAISLTLADSMKSPWSDSVETQVRKSEQRQKTLTEVLAPSKQDRRKQASPMLSSN